MLSTIKGAYLSTMKYLAGKLGWVFSTLDQCARPVTNWMFWNDAPTPTMWQFTQAFFARLGSFAIAIAMAALMVSMIAAITWVLAFVLPLLVANLVACALCLWFMVELLEHIVIWTAVNHA